MRRGTKRRNEKLKETRSSSNQEGVNEEGFNETPDEIQTSINMPDTQITLQQNKSIVRETTTLRKNSKENKSFESPTNSESSSSNEILNESLLQTPINIPETQITHVTNESILRKNSTTKSKKNKTHYKISKSLKTLNSDLLTDIRNKSADSGIQIPAEILSYPSSLIPISKSRRKNTVPKHIKEIRYFQSTTHFLIPRIPFYRLVREILNQNQTSFLLSKLSFDALREAAETYLVQFFEDAFVCCTHRNRKTLGVADMELVRFLRGPCDPCNRF